MNTNKSTDKTILENCVFNTSTVLTLDISMVLKLLHLLI